MIFLVIYDFMGVLRFTVYLFFFFFLSVLPLCVLLYGDRKMLYFSNIRIFNFILFFFL